MLMFDKVTNPIVRRLDETPACWDLPSVRQHPIRLLVLATHLSNDALIKGHQINKISNFRSMDFLGYIYSSLFLAGTFFF